METPIAPFPNSSEFRLDAVERDDLRQVLRLVVTSTARAAACPECHQPSHRSHSRYWRTLADLPWAEYTVQVRVGLHKWQCRTTDCQRRVFCKGSPWSRDHTGGARLVWRLGNITSPWPWAVLQARASVPG